ncbi:MAG: hypothetical protein E6I63_03310 [Chloroflexi bacterium]|nr:MAG: hypothetical protein E6I63_03310 [Chloroflexota bacterium]
MSPAAQKHVVKKYSNRKLYDTRSRRYITLDDIARMVRAGEDVTVIQRDTGRDLTPIVLSQIVAREERQSSGNGHAHEEGAEGPVERGQALLDYLRRTISMPAELVSGQLGQARGDLEGVVEVAITQALKRLNIPTRRDIGRLNARLDALEARLGGKRPSRRPTARARTRKGAA